MLCKTNLGLKMESGNLEPLAFIGMREDTH